MIPIVLSARGGNSVIARIRHHSLQTFTQSIMIIWQPRLRPSPNHVERCRQQLSMSMHSKRISNSSDSFQGLSLTEKIDESIGNRSSIHEAEVVPSVEDMRKIRSLIKEATRAKMTAHYSDAGVSTEKSCDDVDGEEGKVKSDAYERRLHQLVEAQRLHREVDPTQTLAYTHSCMIIGELKYEIGHLDDAQDMYMTALKNIMSINCNSGGIDSGDEHYEGIVRGQLMIAQCMHSLGAIHARCGEHEEAVRWYNESLNRKQHILHEVSEPTARSFSLRFELGKTYNGLAILEIIKDGEVQWDNAVSLFRKAEWNYLHGYDTRTLNEQDIQSETDLKPIDEATIQRMSPRHVEALINVRSNMGELLRQRGQYENAATTLWLALDLARISLDCVIEKEATKGGTNIISSTSWLDGPCPEERRNVVVDLMLQIADALMSANNFDDAAASYEQALSAHISFRSQSKDTTRSDRKTFLPSTFTAPKMDNIDLSAATRVEATIRTNLAHALAQLGKDNLSLEQYKAALSIKRRIGGDFHLDVAHALMDMGALLGGPLRDFTKALICFKEALYIYRANLEECDEASECDSKSEYRNEKTSIQSFLDDDDMEEMERHVENALKNISLIEAALRKDRDEKSIRRRK